MRKLDRITGLVNKITVADVLQNSEIDWLYALAFATDLLQLKDPQLMSYKKNLFLFFEECINSKKVTKSFPSIVRVQGNKRKINDAANPPKKKSKLGK